MKHVLLPALVMLAMPSLAQAPFMPAIEVTPDEYLEQLPTPRIRTMYDGISNDFLFELQDRDLANLFNYGLPPASQTMEGSDMLVIIRDDWETLEQFWTTVGVSVLADEVRPYTGMGTAAPNVVTTKLISPQGHTLRVYQFTRFALGETQSERCMARKVIDDTYRGLGNGSFNAFLCSRNVP